MTERISGFQFGEDRREHRGPAHNYRRNRTRNNSSGFSARAYTLRLWSATFGWLAAMGAGALMSESMWIESVETTSGPAVVFNQPPMTWWYSIGLGVVAMFLIIAAMGGSR